MKFKLIKFCNILIFFIFIILIVFCKGKTTIKIQDEFTPQEKFIKKILINNNVPISNVYLQLCINTSDIILKDINNITLFKDYIKMSIVDYTSINGDKINRIQTELNKIVTKLENIVNNILEKKTII